MIESKVTGGRSLPRKGKTKVKRGYNSLLTTFSGSSIRGNNFVPSSTNPEIAAPTACQTDSPGFRSFATVLVPVSLTKSRTLFSKKEDWELRALFVCSMIGRASLIIESVDIPHTELRKTFLLLGYRNQLTRLRDYLEP